MATTTESVITGMNYYYASKITGNSNINSLENSLKGIIELFSNKQNELTEAAIYDFGECLSLSKYVKDTAQISDSLQEYYAATVKKNIYNQDYKEESEIKRIA